MIEKGWVFTPDTGSRKFPPKPYISDIAQLYLIHPISIKQNRLKALEIQDFSPVSNTPCKFFTFLLHR